MKILSFSRLANIVLVLILSSVAYSQIGGRGGPGPIAGRSVINVTADPSGACTGGPPLRYNTTNGKLWGCDAGTWATVSGGGGTTSPGGSNTQVQFNDSGAFGGNSGLTFNKTTGNLAIGTTVLLSPPAGGANFAPTLLAAIATNKNIQLAGGTYNLDNSGGPIALGAFAGTITGAGFSTSLVCGTLGTDCITSAGSSFLQLTEMQISFGPTATARTAGFGLNIDGDSNVMLSHLWLHNGNLAGIRLANSTAIKMKDMLIQGFMANGFYSLNNVNFQTTNLSCSGNGDACWESSYYDSATQHACTDITVNGLNSANDLSGIIVNGCQRVSISNFNVDGPAKNCVNVDQDSSTTTTSYPDLVQISNGSCSNVGHGTNPLNGTYGPNAQGLNVDIAGSPSSIQRVAFSNIQLVNVSGCGIRLADSGTVDLDATNVSISNVGNGASTSCPDGIYLDGDHVNLSNIQVSLAQRYSLNNNATTFLSGANIISINPNVGVSTTVAIYNKPNDWTSLIGVNLIDTNATNRSGIQVASTSGSQWFTNVSTYAAATWPTTVTANATGTIVAITNFTQPYITGYGTANTFFGTTAGNQTFTGAGKNTGFGTNVLNALTTGVSNMAFGAYGMQSVTSGGHNISMGDAALASLITGSGNTAIGDNSVNSIVSASGCTGVGQFALINATACPNDAVGKSSLSGITSGTNNSALGLNSGSNFTTATKTLSLGYNANAAGTDGINHSTALGADAQNTASNQIILGTSSDITVAPGGYTSSGTFPTITGCGTISATSGGSTAGKFTTSMAGTCTAVIPLPTSPSGWTCYVQDITKHIATNILIQSASSTTSCTVTGTTAASDVITFMAIGW